MNNLASEYREWILAQQLDGRSFTEGDSGNLEFAGELVHGWVGFYELEDATIIELRLDDVLDGESIFFLHFELEDLDRAKELFGEMEAAYDEIQHKEVRHVLLCCSVGMTSTFFAMKLNETAQQLGVDYDFEAMSIQAAKEKGADYAAVLLAPQVGHMRKEVAEALPGIPVIEIPGKIFGSYDAKAALRLIMDVLSGSRVAKDDMHLHPIRAYDKTKRVLALSYIHREDEPTLAYRVLDKGETAASGMLVRRTFSIHILEDLAATLRVQGWRMNEFDAIGLAVPGVVDGSVVVNVRDGKETRFDLGERLTEMWKTNVYIDYNATAAAVGCYVSQDEWKNVAFHAQAIGVPDGEEGYILAGKPFVGHGGRSGHLGPLASGFALDMELEDASWRVDGLRQLVARYVASLACTIAPEAIYVWCDFLPDMEELHDELAKTLPEDAIPALVEVSNYDEAVLVGELSLCLNRIAQK